MKRTLEISAPTIEEARKLAGRQLLEGEAILGEEIVSTPDQGIFGAAGTEQIHARFTLGPDRTTSLLELLKPVCDTLGLGDVTFEPRVEPDRLLVDIKGDDAQDLIGKHGKTIDALEYLCNIIFNRGAIERQRVVLDVGGYRAERHDNLLELATRMAHKAAESGRPVELEPMSTMDRRTVHLALKELGTVSTLSKGIEPMRKVVIIPLRGQRDAGAAAATVADEQTPPTRQGPPPARGRRSPRPAPAPAPAPAPSRSVPMFLGDGDEDD